MIEFGLGGLDWIGLDLQVLDRDLIGGLGLSGVGFWGLGENYLIEIIISCK